MYWDEASIGYNAYSVLKTGKDEWGETLPLHFRAFGEFKLPTYIYSVVIFESIYGLTPYAVRLPAVIYGFLTVLGLYFLIFYISKNKKISLLSSFLFTITPWFFIFSRTGYEATAGLAFFIYALYFLLRSNEKRLNILISIVLFMLSAYSYNSFRILTPLILGPFLLIYGIKAFKKKQKGDLISLFLSLLILFVSIIPIYKLYSKDSGLSRLQTVGTNRNLVSNYFKNFSYNFLFVNGDTNPRNQIPGSSQLYYLDAVFILLGIIYILKKKDINNLYILALLILAPIPAAITRENPHALRAILVSPVLVTISAMGIYYLSELVKKRKNLILIVVLALYVLSFERYIYKFGNEYNNLSFDAWQYQYKELIEKNSDNFSKYEKVYITDKYAQPYIFFLFYQKVDPNLFINTKTLNDVSDWGFSTVKSFDKFNFIKDCGVNSNEKSLVICPK
ncbi:MAG: glycosyltransferase family 39 protein [bacterium]|nr:glycosyltransferase family 39 protein [bacterium]